MNIKLLIIALCLIGLSLGSHAESLKIGDHAPDFQATTLDGHNVSLASFAGNKNVLLKFWATWCHYCKAEMPHLQDIFNNKPEDLEILLVNVGINDSVENIQSYFKTENFNIPVIFDKKGDIVSQYKVVGTPQQVYIDKNGEIAYQAFLMTDELESLITGK